MEHTNHEMLLGDPVKALLAEKGADVVTIAPEQTVAAAVKLMHEKGIGSILVARGAVPLGIFTERDILNRLVSEGRDPAATKVSDIMTRNMVAISPEVKVAEAMAIVTEKRVRHLPVVQDGKLVGIVSSGDLTKWVVRRQKTHIEDLMQYIAGSYPS